MKKILTLFCCLLHTLTYSNAQSEFDTSTIDGVLNATYEILSGPAGERNWEEYKTLFHTDGYMGATIVDPEGQRKFYSFSVDKYIANNDPFLKKNDFYEEEIGRSISIFGGIAQVKSAYQYKLSKDGNIEKKGINCLQLVYDNGRWKILSLIWEEESENHRIPDDLLFPTPRE